MTKGLTLSFTADTPEELIDLARRFAAIAPDLAFAARVTPAPDTDRPQLDVEIGGHPATWSPDSRPLVNTVSDMADDATEEPVHEVHENAVTDLTATEMVERGIKTLMQLAAKDGTKMEEVKRLQSKFGVKKLSEIKSDRAAEFFQDTILLAAGTKEAA